MAAEYKERHYVPAGSVDISELEPLDPATDKIMKGEFRTGFGLSLVYFAFIFSIPVLNWYASELMLTKFWGGMTISWFMTAIGSLAVAVIIAYIHVNLYEKRLKNYESLTTTDETTSVERGIS
ncbi:DUF485 domain-containing protein [Calidifontibacillus oryziterrae]|uniref:hypothetical protein n=1 Tax=Calidifontibacillus oryziterrae TaxID=1191699 RepID=UPI0003189921|nr:hypothetical protein [Calidifontibacillus oryziterrae]